VGAEAGPAVVGVRAGEDRLDVTTAAVGAAVRSHT
jgi:hypothetical protein